MVSHQSVRQTKGYPWPNAQRQKVKRGAGTGGPVHAGGSVTGGGVVTTGVVATTTGVVATGVVATTGGGVVSTTTVVVWTSKIP